MMTTANSRRTAPVIAALVVVCLAALARGEAPAGAIVRPAVDAAGQTEAAARGKALLAKPIWKVELDCAHVELRLVDDWLICRGTVTVHPPDAPPGATVSQTRFIVLDSRTGRSDWKPSGRFPVPEIWGDRDGGLLDFLPEALGKLTLRRRTPAKPEGALVWESTYAAQAAPDVRRALPIIADQQVIAGEEILVGTSSGRAVGRAPQAQLTIRSFDRKTGKVQWQTPVSVPVFRVEVEGVAQGRVYIRVMETQSVGFFMALNAANGKLLWNSESGPDLPESAFQGATFYTLARSGELVAYDGQTGKANWRTTLSRECDPAKPTSGALAPTKLFVDNDGIYAAFTDSSGAGIAVLDPSSGKQTGYFNGDGLLGARSQRVSDLSVQGKLLLAVTSKNCLAIDRRTLQLQWTVTLDNELHGTNAAAISDGVLFVNASANGQKPQQIVAVDIRQK